MLPVFASCGKSSSDSQTPAVTQSQSKQPPKPEQLGSEPSTNPTVAASEASNTTASEPTPSPSLTLPLSFHGSIEAQKTESGWVVGIKPAVEDLAEVRLAQFVASMNHGFCSSLDDSLKHAERCKEDNENSCTIFELLSTPFFQMEGSPVAVLHFVFNSSIEQFRELNPNSKFVIVAPTQISMAAVIDQVDILLRTKKNASWKVPEIENEVQSQSVTALAEHSKAAAYRVEFRRQLNLSKICPFLNIESRTLGPKAIVKNFEIKLEY